MRAQDRRSQGLAAAADLSICERGGIDDKALLMARTSEEGESDMPEVYGGPQSVFRFCEGSTRSRYEPSDFLSAIILQSSLCSQQQAGNFMNTSNRFYAREMATFVPISYTYVSTAPRSKSATARRKSDLKPVSIFDKIQRIKRSGAALTFGVRDATAEEAVLLVTEDLIVLLGDDDSSASKVGVGSGDLRAESAAADEGLLDSPETAMTRQLRPLLPVPMYSTILMTSLRRHSACGALSKNPQRPIACTLMLPLPVPREERQRQEKQEDEDYDNDDKDGRQPQQEVKEDAAAALMTGKSRAGQPRSTSRAKPSWGTVAVTTSLVTLPSRTNASSS
ncbi:MAG: hypothetical protein M1839_001903 [Geoglossum umbratile]|nr:MAG: hypothetical protein M1839_001903 [Geoglossum umbratile]